MFGAAGRLGSAGRRLQATRARPPRPRQRRQAVRRRRHRWHARSQQQRQGQRRPPPPTPDPRWVRFCRDDRRETAAAATILADSRLFQLTALACKAQSAVDLDAIGLQRAALIVEHCEAAGLRWVACGGGSSSSSSHTARPCRQAPLPVLRDIAERHSLPDLQRALRKASQAIPGSPGSPCQPGELAGVADAQGGPLV